ncbi:MAG: adenosylhomocysteinase [Christensenellales bacterium]|jgi:adenosylhomocysteinase
MTSIVRNPALAQAGLTKIEWARRHMPVVGLIEKRFIEEKPFQGLRVAMSIHLEAKTARTALLLKNGGAEVYATGCNPLSTQDDVAAGLASQGVTVNAWYGATDAEYHEHLLCTLSCKPHIIIDDGGDLTQILCDERPDLAECLIGGGEETTTGVMRLRARAEEGSLRFPMIAVNDAQMKFLFDNRYGTGQSVWDGIMRTTNLIVAGKDVVVAGYGWCGKGVAMRAKGMGARVIVCEVNPIKAVEAAMDGFSVMKMDDAAKIGDLFITVTGCKDVITMRHIRTMKEGAVLSNAGHFDVEVAVAEMRRAATRVFEARHNIEGFEFENGHTVYLIAEGRLVNLAAADGHPAEIMDMSFALQALTAEYMAKHGKTMENKAYDLPEEIDRAVAKMKLSVMHLTIDALTPEQEKYIYSAN